METKYIFGFILLGLLLTYIFSAIIISIWRKNKINKQILDLLEYDAYAYIKGVGGDHIFGSKYYRAHSNRHRFLFSTYGKLIDHYIIPKGAIHDTEYDWSRRPNAVSKLRDVWKISYSDIYLNLIDNKCVYMNSRGKNTVNIRMVTDYRLVVTATDGNTYYSNYNSTDGIESTYEHILGKLANKCEDKENGNALTNFNKDFIYCNEVVTVDKQTRKRWFIKGDDGEDHQICYEIFNGKGHKIETSEE